VNKLNAAQLKALSGFSNTVAATWFSAGIITPFFSKFKTLTEVLYFPLIGGVIASFMLWVSLYLLRGVNND